MSTDTLMVASFVGLGAVAITATLLSAYWAIKLTTTEHQLALTIVEREQCKADADEAWAYVDELVLGHLPDSSTEADR